MAITRVLYCNLIGRKLINSEPRYAIPAVGFRLLINADPHQFKNGIFRNAPLAPNFESLQFTRTNHRANLGGGKPDSVPERA